MWPPYKIGRRQSSRREGNRKEREMHGEGCEEGEGSQEEGIRGRQSSVRIPPISRGSGIPGQQGFTYERHSAVWETNSILEKRGHEDMAGKNGCKNSQGPGYEGLCVLFYRAGH